MAQAETDNIILTDRMGSRLATARAAAGLSVLQLAEMIGASTSQVICYEKGNYTIAIERLFQIAAILQVPVCDIFDA